MAPTPSSPADHPIADRPQPTAWPSLLLPGLAQMLDRRPKQGCAILLMGFGLIGAGMALGRSAGLSAEIFYFVTIVLPWWLLQAYDATLPIPDGGWPLQDAFRAALAQAHDIRYLGLLFLLTALMDLYIILVNPEYALALFCSKPGGWIGVLAKIQSPTIHLLIGYGFLQARRWALLLYLAYAGFGLMNATVNFACFGYGRVRAVFFLSLLGFTGYIWWRRARFR